MKQIILLEYTDKELLFLKSFSYPKEQEEAHKKFKEISENENTYVSMMTKERFFELCIEPTLLAEDEEE